MITHNYLCPIGCLIKVTHQSEIAEHQEEHLRKILNYVKYQSDERKAYEQIAIYLATCMSNF